MIRSFSERASRALAGALLAAALALPAAAASAEDMEYSSQGREGTGAAGLKFQRGGLPQIQGGPPAGAGPRGFGGTPRITGAPGGVPRGMGGRSGGPGPHFGRPGQFSPQFRGPGFRGPAVGFRGPRYGGRAAFIRGRHHVRRRGLLLPLIGLGALGAIYVGSRPYTPYAYVDGPFGPECSGPTEDGVCELRMTEVPLEGGGAELQCVAYCP